MKTGPVIEGIIEKRVVKERVIEKRIVEAGEIIAIAVRTVSVVVVIVFVLIVVLVFVIVAMHDHVSVLVILLHFRIAGLVAITLLFHHRELRIASRQAEEQQRNGRKREELRNSLRQPFHPNHPLGTHYVRTPPLNSSQNLSRFQGYFPRSVFANRGGGGYILRPASAHTSCAPYMPFWPPSTRKK
ncbi:hypothetical protein [Rhodocaloribacter sp.]